MFVRIWLIFGLTVFFSSCSNNGHLSNAKTSGNVSSNQAHNSKNRDRLSSPVKAIGIFSNRESNGEHEWGYEVDIWEHNGDLIGMLSGSDSTQLVGDPPTGILKNVMYNHSTGSISFRATLPGVEYKFKGTLSQKKLSGILFDMPYDDVPEKIVLLKSQKLTAEMNEYPSLKAWQERMDELIEFRGVKRTSK